LEGAFGISCDHGDCDKADQIQAKREPHFWETETIEDTNSKMRMGKSPTVESRTDKAIVQNIKKAGIDARGKAYECRGTKPMENHG
jgi:hypothetical protein